MGKYDGYNLEKLPDQEPPSRRERLNEVKESITQRTSSALALTYAKVRKEKQEAEETLKEIQLRLDAVQELLVDAFEQEDVTSLGTSLGTVRVQQEPYAGTKDRDAVRKWAIENGLERSLQLPWQTLNSLCKERLVAGKPEPEGVGLWMRDKVVFTKKK